MISGSLKISKGNLKMDIKAEVIEIIDELFMEDVSDMMDEDLLMLVFLIQWELLNLSLNWNHVLIFVSQFQNLVVMIGTQLIRLLKG